MYSFNVKKGLFQTIRFSISTQFISIWPIDRTLSGATILGQSGPGSDGNEGVIRISQSSSITGTAPSDCLVSFPGHSLWGSYPSAEMQSVYSTTPADWATSKGLNNIITILLQEWRSLFIILEGCLMPRG